VSDEIFTDDCVFYEPNGVYRGRDEINRVAGAIKATQTRRDLSIGASCRYQKVALQRLARPSSVLNRGHHLATRTDGFLFQASRESFERLELAR
jgi:hypothetical protein